MTEEHENFSIEEIAEIKEMFDEEFWPKMKSRLKDASKREACFISFIAGYDLMEYQLEEEIENAKEELSKMKPEEFGGMIRKDLKDFGEKNKEEGDKK